MGIAIAELASYTFSGFCTKAAAAAAVDYKQLAVAADSHWLSFGNRKLCFFLLVHSFQESKPLYRGAVTQVS